MPRTGSSGAPLEAARAFYTQPLGFQVYFDGEGFLGLRSNGGAAEIGFMRPDPEHGENPYAGEGVTLGLEVADPDAEHDRLRTRGLTVGLPLADYPWGDRAFAVQDPVGVRIHVYRPGAPTLHQAIGRGPGDGVP